MGNSHASYDCRISILCILLFIFGSSCSNKTLYRPKAKIESDKFFECYKDSVVFSYKRDIRYSADYDVIHPIPFTVTLPPGIIDYFYVNSEEFIFYYKFDQIIYISIDLRHSIKKVQYKYVPTKEEVDSLLSIPDQDAGKIFDLQVDFAKRKNLIIKKDNFTILLCNLKEKNSTKFSNIISKSKLLRI